MQIGATDGDLIANRADMHELGFQRRYFSL
jgi:hypothetical protein